MLVSQSTPEPLKIFLSYSHEDGALRRRLGQHLANLRRQRLVTIWHDREIGAGMEWKEEIDEHLEQADIILLLVSASFIDSDYCTDIEVVRAMARHEEQAARV